MITLIAAVDQEDGIGKNGSIPWNNFEDMNFFKNETTGGAIIMGSRTWASLNRVPLPNRVNIVVGTTYLKDIEHHTGHTLLCFVSSVEGAIALAMKMRSRIYGIGGERIYKSMLPLADRILLSVIPGKYDCDTFFPSFDSYKWKRTHLSFPNLEVIEHFRKAPPL